MIAFAGFQLDTKCPACTPGQSCRYLLASLQLPLSPPSSPLHSGRASLSPILDLFVALLSLGESGLKAGLQARRTVAAALKSGIAALAARHGERLLHTPHNPISFAMTLSQTTGAWARMQGEGEGDSFSAPLPVSEPPFSSSAAAPPAYVSTASSTASPTTPPRTAASLSMLVELDNTDGGGATSGCGNVTAASVVAPHPALQPPTTLTSTCSTADAPVVGGAEGPTVSGSIASATASNALSLPNGVKAFAPSPPTTCIVSTNAPSETPPPLTSRLLHSGYSSCRGTAAGARHSPPTAPASSSPASPADTLLSDARLLPISAHATHTGSNCRYCGVDGGAVCDGASMPGPAAPVVSVAAADTSSASASYTSSTSSIEATPVKIKGGSESRLTIHPTGESSIEGPSQPPRSQPHHPLLPQQLQQPTQGVCIDGGEAKSSTWSSTAADRATTSSALARAAVAVPAVAAAVAAASACSPPPGKTGASMRMGGRFGPTYIGEGGREREGGWVDWRIGGREAVLYGVLCTR